MLREQEQVAIDVKAFLAEWGLKAKYIAKVCELSPKVLSQFINHKLALSHSQLDRLTSYIADYERRNR